MIPVKVCGITTVDDALACVEHGAAALGFVFAPSKRQIWPEQARLIRQNLPSNVVTVGVFVNEAVEVVRSIIRDCRLDLVQFHGDESPEYCRKFQGIAIKAFRAGFDIPEETWAEAGLCAVLIDGASAGSGVAYDWRLFRDYHYLPFPKILAGGLNPDNLRDAIRQTVPDGVDVSSGVEREPGRKDPDKVKRFIEIASSCSGELNGNSSVGKRIFKKR
ncbi:MAG TPA: phosphoribosylanthranilate isomerase [Bacillota bacterium]|nr:phosphoribosylanthranilate isomerase [Bacillota bacterium]HPT88508.1 phosphoribosylanthranilate isomerase [Bacillota bacterium]